MARRDILIAPHNGLREVCAPVDAVDAGVRRLMGDMLETMYAAPGIGLAAPQIGITKRVIVMDTAAPDTPPQPLKMANPELVWFADERASHSEGCLSFPDQWADVVRPRACRVRYLDETGTTRELDAEGLLAVCVQHEIDHLNGVLFIDHLSSLKRGMVMRKLSKWKKAQAA